MNESFTYFKNDDVSVDLQNIEGFFFVSLKVIKLTPSSIRILRWGFNRLLKDLAKLDVDLIHATGYDKQSIRLWNLVKPCNRIDEVPESPGVFVGCWHTEDD
jgi:hypothetical protein